MKQGSAAQSQTQGRPEAGDTTRTVQVKTERRTHLVDITAEVQRVVTESRVQSGVCHLYVSHTTAGLCPDSCRKVEGVFS
ncbi:MAG: YjbQ family protein [Candidatus Acidiferrales bacterium]